MKIGETKAKGAVNHEIIGLASRVYQCGENFIFLTGGVSMQTAR
jgi:hypothetical protein